MLFWTIIKISLKSLWSNKLRSFLAMLGIIIGIGSVISMLSIATGVKEEIVKNITLMGTDLVFVRPGPDRHGAVVMGPVQNLTVEDGLALARETPGVQRVAVTVDRGAQLKYLDKNSPTIVVGASATYLPMRNYELEEGGRAFTDGEVELMAHVVVLGPVAAERLFEEEDPVGKRIKINGHNFTVIGLTKAKGEQGWRNPDDFAVVPYSTAMKQLFGLDHVHEITIQAVHGTDTGRLEEEITKLMRRRHRLRLEDDNDFHTRNMAEWREKLDEVMATFAIFFGSVGSISLLVGGIGIMNMMLVTVTERTREIGIRKAVGAKERDILKQFLIESILMSAVGGIFGIGLGIGVAKLIGNFSPFTTSVSAFSTTLAMCFAAAVGIFFGFYPARRAAKLDPIEALSYE